MAPYAPAVLKNGYQQIGDVMHDAIVCHIQECLCLLEIVPVTYSSQFPLFDILRSLQGEQDTHAYN